MQVQNIRMVHSNQLNLNSDSKNDSKKSINGKTKKRGWSS